MQLVCAIDVGSTRIKAALVDDRGVTHAIVSTATPGGAGRDPDHAVDAEALTAAVTGLLTTLRSRQPEGSRLEGFCVTGQRATFFAVDVRERALAALSWQDPRAAQDAGTLADEWGADRYQALTGLPCTPIAVLPRLLWLRRRRPEISRATHRIALVADTVLEALGASRRLMDPSNASATGLWDLARGEWSAPLLHLGGLEAGQLPAVVPAGSFAGGLSLAAARATGFQAGTPLLVGGGDQPCATLGMGVVSPGQLGLSLGTAADLTTPVPGVAEPLPGRINTAHVVSGETLLEGFMASFGSALDWSRALRPGPPPPPEADVWSPREDDPLFFPFLAGIATPDFAPAVRGGLLGLAANQDPWAVARAVREGLAMELRRILESPALPAGLEILVACGAAAEDRALLGRIAAVTQLPVSSGGPLEATLIGVACLAWSGLGRYPSAGEAVRAMPPGDQERQVPSPPCESQERRYTRYLRHVALLLEAD